QYELDPKILKEVKRAMVQVDSSGMGTAGRASVPNVNEGGKTGPARWGAGKREQTAAWFAGVAPIDNPKYAFAALYESDAKNADDVHGGSHAAPLIGKVLRELFKEESKPKKKTAKKKSETTEKDEDEEMEVRKA